MKVWIDQDLCTGDGLCEEIAPDVFVLLDDGLAYVREADKVFAAVQQRYPKTIPAERASQKRGARGFSVQLATFASSQAADAAIAALGREAVPAMKQRDAKGRSVVLAGPMQSYQQAQAMKLRYAGRYPDAFIVP